MSTSNFDDTYINYLLENRVMRKTQTPDAYEEYFSILYSRWIVTFLNYKNIQNVPLLLLCNTLSKWPDYFGFINRNFFLMDYYLHDFLYDWNYVLHFGFKREYVVNLYIKLYTESAYINHNYDICYWLCYSSPGIEEFKDEHYYTNSDKAQLEETCQLQLAFAMIHEASHFLILNGKVPNINKESQIKDFSVPAFLNNDLDPSRYYSSMSSDQQTLLIEECFCDEQAIDFILEHKLHVSLLTNTQLFELLFQSILFNYIIAYSEVCQNIDANCIDGYFENSLWTIIYRIGNAYTAVLSFLADHNQGSLINEFVKHYEDEWYESALELIRDVRRITKYLKEQINADFDSNILNSTTPIERIDYIKSYLLIA